MTKRQEAAASTKRKIIEAAKRLITEKGFEAVSVEDITRECGVAKGTFYTYFKRKEDITPEISMEFFESMAEEFAEINEIPVYDRLRRYMHRFMELVQSNGIRICRQWNCQVIDPQDCNGYEESKLKYDIDSLIRILTAWVEQKALKKNTPVDTISYIIISQLYGMMLCWCMSDGRLEPQNLIDSFCDEQLEGLLKKYLNR